MTGIFVYFQKAILQRGPRPYPPILIRNLRARSTHQHGGLRLHNPLSRRHGRTIGPWPACDLPQTPTELQSGRRRAYRAGPLTKRPRNLQPWVTRPLPVRFLDGQFGDFADVEPRLMTNAKVVVDEEMLPYRDSSLPIIIENSLDI